MANMFFSLLQVFHVKIGSPSSRFFVGFRVQHKIPEEGRRMYRPKRCKYNKKKNRDNCLNILSDKKYPFYGDYLYFITSEFKSYWIPHTFSLVRELSKAL